MAAKVQKKPKGAYHHPDLERALVDSAIRTIREDGIEALTLRDVGVQLGVSRSALYRHFADKSALLARVALEGFRSFRQALRAAVDEARGRGGDPLEAMGAAYIMFAFENQSHFQTMFSGAFGEWDRYPQLTTQANGAFEVLLVTIVEEQAAGRVAAAYNPLQVAQVLWAGVHGIAALGMADHLDTPPLELARLHSQILLGGLRPA